MSRSWYNLPHRGKAELKPNRGVELAEDSTRDSRDEAEWVNDVVILETNNESELTVARSLLEAEGIFCFAPGEEGQRLIGAGPMRLCVPVEHEERARALLAHIGPARTGRRIAARRRVGRAENQPLQYASRDPP